MLVTAALIAGLVGSLGGTAQPDRPDAGCRAPERGHARVHADLVVRLADSATPDLEATTTVRVPADWPDLATLRRGPVGRLGDGDDPIYRSAIDCLFPGDEWAYQPWSSRQERPWVESKDGSVTFRRRTSGYVSSAADFAGGEMHIGPWSVTVRNDDSIRLQLLPSGIPKATWTADISYRGTTLSPTTVMADEDDGASHMAWTVERNGVTQPALEGQLQRAASWMMVREQRQPWSGMREASWHVTRALPLMFTLGLLWLARKRFQAAGRPPPGIGWLGLGLLAVTLLLGFTRARAWLASWLAYWPPDWLPLVGFVLIGGVLYAGLLPDGAEHRLFGLSRRRHRVIVLGLIALTLAALGLHVTDPSWLPERLLNLSAAGEAVALAPFLMLTAYLWYASVLGFAVLRGLGPARPPPSWLGWATTGVLAFVALNTVQWTWLSLDVGSYPPLDHLRFLAHSLGDLAWYLAIALLVGLLCSLRLKDDSGAFFPTPSTAGATPRERRRRHSPRLHDRIVVVLFCTAVVGSSSNLFGFSLPIAFVVAFVLLSQLLRWGGLVEWADERTRHDNPDPDLPTFNGSPLAGLQEPMLVDLDEARLLVDRLKKVETKFADGDLDVTKFEADHKSVRDAIDAHRNELTVATPVPAPAPAGGGGDPPSAASGRVLRVKIPEHPLRLALSLGPYRSWWRNGRLAARRGLWLVTPLLVWFVTSAVLRSDDPTWPLTQGFGLYFLVATILQELVFWITAAFVLGCVYAYLPGAWGMLKGGCLAAVYLLAVATEALLPQLLGRQPPATGWLLRAILLAVFLSLVGLLVDIKTLRQYHFRTAAAVNLYRLTQVRGIVVYATSLVVAAIAVYQQVRAGQTANPFTDPDQAAKVLEQATKLVQGAAGGAGGGGGGGP